MRKAGKEERKKKRKEGEKAAAAQDGRTRRGKKNFSMRSCCFFSHQLSHRVVDHVSMCWRGGIVGRGKREDRQAGVALLLIRHVLDLVLEGLLGRLGQTLTLGLNAAHEHTRKRANEAMELRERHANEGADRARALLSWPSVRPSLCHLCVRTGGARAFPRRP